MSPKLILAKPPKPVNEMSQADLSPPPLQTDGRQGWGAPTGHNRHN